MSVLAALLRLRGSGWWALGSALLLIAVGVLATLYEESLYRSEKVQEASVQASILGASVTAALVFDDPAAAQEYANALESNPEVEMVAVYNLAGLRIAGFSRQAAVHPADSAPEPGVVIAATDITVSQTVRKDGMKIGTVYLRAAMDPFQRRLLRYGGIILLVVMALLVLAVSAASQGALTSANAKLSVVNKELESFSYSVSHDLRAPLRSIDGFSQALFEDYAERLDETGRNYLTRIRQAAQRMGQLIDDLLTLSRISRIEPNFENVDLGLLAREITETLRAAAPERQVEVQVGSQLNVRGDSRLLRIALENLLGNAWKFTASRRPARIQVKRVLVNGEISYCVRDNGAGFDMAYSNQLFGAFQRLHDARVFPGTGIGLATVQRIIHRHGGRVWAEGAVDQGAAFYFTLQTGAANG